MGITVDTAGADRLAASLAAAADALEDPAPVLATVGNQVVTGAAARAPRRTGALAGSGSADPVTLDGRPAQLLTWGVRYAVYVNFGTATMTARPFASDALEAAARDAGTELATWAEQAIAQVHA